MKDVGLFEAKTKFSEICAEVSAKGVGVVITRRGKPLVKIEPISTSAPKSVWDFRIEHEKKNGPLTEKFDLPQREKQSWRNPLDK